MHTHTHTYTCLHYVLMHKLRDKHARSPIAGSIVFLKNTKMKSECETLANGVSVSTRGKFKQEIFDKRSAKLNENHTCIIYFPLECTKRIFLNNKENLLSDLIRTALW